MKTSIPVLKQTHSANNMWSWSRIHDDDQAKPE